MRAVAVVVVSAAAVLAFWLLLSQRHVPGPYTPEVAGVIVASDRNEANFARYRLTNGETVTVNDLDGRATTRVYRAGDAIGSLLLAGSGPDRPWFALVPAARPSIDRPIGCYSLNTWGTDEGDWIQTDVGLRLRKAPGFDAGLLAETPGGVVPTPRVGMRYQAVQQVFCLNEEGLVTARR
jgi:hypothetical protein